MAKTPRMKFDKSPGSDPEFFTLAGGGSTALHRPVGCWSRKSPETAVTTAVSEASDVQCGPIGGFHH